METVMRLRPLGKNGPVVCGLGVGCMGMSEFYGRRHDAESTATIHRSIELGITFLDTADIYGYGDNEVLVGQAIRGMREKVFLATKFGIVRDKANPSVRGVNGRPEYVKRSEEHTSELQSRLHLVCRLLLEKKKKQSTYRICKMHHTAHRND